METLATKSKKRWWFVTSFGVRNIVVTAVFTLTTCLISVLVPNVTTVIAIMGGTCSVSFQFTFPCKRNKQNALTLLLVYCKVKLSGKPWYDKENLAAFLSFSVLIAIGYVSVIASVYLLATGQTMIGDRSDIINQ